MVSGLNLRICGWKYRVLKTSICANKFDNGHRVWQLVAGRVLWSVLEYWTTGRANITSSRLCHMSRWILMKGLFRMHASIWHIEYIFLLKFYLIFFPGLTFDWLSGLIWDSFSMWQCFTMILKPRVLGFSIETKTPLKVFLFRELSKYLSRR